MTVPEPLVSVIIPSFNRAHLIQDALQSVFAQTFKDFEIILIDDGSTDGTQDLIAAKYAGRLRYIRQENRGISGARNRGIEEAAGKYIAFLDSDDLWRPEKLAKQTAFMEAQPELGMTCTKLYRYEVGKESERQVCPNYFSPKFEDLLNSNNYIPTTTVMVRSEVFRRLGGFDTSLLVAEDFDLWLRIMNQYPCAILEDVLAEHRDHPRKTTRDLIKVYDGYWRFYSKTLKLYPKQIRDYKAFRDRGISFEYLLGTEMLRKGFPASARKHIFSALLASACIGAYFAKPSGEGKIALIVKPYLALASAYLKSCFLKKSLVEKHL